MNTKKNSKYRIELANKKVEKQILNLPEEYNQLVIKNIADLSNNPRPKGVKKIIKNIYRIRVGRYRIIYEINDNYKLIVITKVAKRDENTYRRY